jgi:hypothetical protein
MRENYSSRCKLWYGKYAMIPNTFARQNTDPMKQSKHNTNSKQKAQKHNKHFTKSILVDIGVSIFLVWDQIKGNYKLFFHLYNI